MKTYLGLIVLFFVCLMHATSAQSSSEQLITYTIGYSDTPPLSFKNQESQKPEGFAIDLMNEIARLNQFEINWQYNAFTQLLDQIKNKQINAVMSVGYSEERAQYMTFSKNNFSNVWGQVFVSNDSNIESIFDLEGKTVALMTNDVNGINFIKQCDVFEVNCQYVYSNTYHEVFQKLYSGSADAAVSNNLVGINFQDDYAMLASSIIFDPFKVFIAVPKNTNKPLLDSYDNTMSVWKQNPDSFYYQLRYRWTSHSNQDIISVWVWYAILGLIVFSTLAALAAILFKRQVNKRLIELSQRETQLNQIINVVPHMIYANDEDGNLILANETASELFGLKDIKNNNIFNVLKANDKFKNLVHYTQSTNPFDTEIIITDHSGTDKTLMMSKVPFTSGSATETSVVTVGVDISQIKAYEREIMYLAKFDALTGLPNRDLLRDRLKSSLVRAIQYQHVGGILHIDLDNFKNINDSKGHKVGDELLKKVALRIKSCANPGDTIARLGSDEFILELPELKNDVINAEKQAIEMAQNISEKIKQPIEINANHYNITTSIGIVIYPRDGESQSILLQRADTAMFEAKSKGRNRIEVFTKNMESKVKKNHQLENDLRLALSNNEIHMVFQPIMHAGSGRMVGSEILLRWSHPTEGEISPNDFIPIAERSQLILDIGYWTIEQACQEIISWSKNTNEPFFFAVNLSVTQIRDRHFLPRVTELIHKYKIPQHHLEFEMTESILLTESKKSLEMIQQLKLLGIKLSIDDFGTGYSSFEYIRKLPLDKIKIDRSFIRDIPEDNSSSAIVKTILAMAEEMQLEVVAEGIENHAQIDFLKQNHCQYFQGYYFSEPVNASNLIKQR